jgi:nitroreductase
MDIRTAIKGRRSIRRFKSDEVPQDIIREILEESRWAPSWGNTQPWELYVVSGEILERLKEGNVKNMVEGVTQQTEIPMPEKWPENLQQRSRGVGRSMFSALSIARDDKDARNKFYGEMYNLFGAPCLIFACVDKSLSIEYAMLDIGLIMQTICLLAHEKGLGTCMMAVAVRNPGLLRKLLPIPEDKIIILGTALGYPDQDSPVNHFDRERASIDELVTWIK